MKSPPKYVIWLSRVGVLGFFGTIMNDPDGTRLAQRSSSAFTYFLQVILFAACFLLVSYWGLYPWPEEEPR